MAEFAQGAEGDGSTVVRVVGEIDVSTTSDFLAAGRAALSDSDAVEFDLSGVTFMDTAGLGVMLKLRSEAVEQGASLTFSNVNARIHRLLEITGLDAILDIHASRETDPTSG